MPRIRSIHPGFWTDEAVVSVSRDARLLYIGLWNQCDDKGAFEWKPVMLKMRLFPADADVDIARLLRELDRAALITSYTVDGHKFGAVKNFQKYQRPKKPNDLYPMPDEIRGFCKGAGTGSEPVGNQSGKVSAEEGGRREEGVPPLGVQGVRSRRKKKAPATFHNGNTELAAEILEDRNVEASHAHQGGPRVVHLPRRAHRC